MIQMKEKEAKARIKINKLLEDAGWRFFDDDSLLRYQVLSLTGFSIQANNC